MTYSYIKRISLCSISNTTVPDITWYPDSVLWVVILKNMNSCVILLTMIIKWLMLLSFKGMDCQWVGSKAQVYSLKSNSWRKINIFIIVCLIKGFGGFTSMGLCILISINSILVISISSIFILNILVISISNILIFSTNTRKIIISSILILSTKHQQHEASAADQD